LNKLHLLSVIFWRIFSFHW